jgi:hypothetical protein
VWDSFWPGADITFFDCQCNSGFSNHAISASCFAFDIDFPLLTNTFNDFSFLRNVSWIENLLIETWLNVTTTIPHNDMLVLGSLLNCKKEKGERKNNKGRKQKKIEKKERRIL